MEQHKIAVKWSFSQRIYAGTERHHYSIFYLCTVYCYNVNILLFNVHLLRYLLPYLLTYLLTYLHTYLLIYLLTTY